MEHSTDAALHTAASPPQRTNSVLDHTSTQKEALPLNEGAIKEHQHPLGWPLGADTATAANFTGESKRVKREANSGLGRA